MEERDQEPEWAEKKHLAVMPAGKLGKAYSKIELQHVSSHSEH